MAKTRCPYGLRIGNDHLDHQDCVSCRSSCRAIYGVCQALATTQNERLFTFGSSELIHFARICLNLDFDTFAKVVYGEPPLLEGRMPYLKSKYKVWNANPMELICQLSSGNLGALAAYMNRRLEEGDS